MTKSDTYKAFCKFEIDRTFSPNDKAMYTTEFALDLDDINEADDPDVHAIASAYDWFQYIMNEVKNDLNKIRHTKLTVYVNREDKDIQLFDWTPKNEFSIKESIQEAISSVL